MSRPARPHLRVLESSFARAVLGAAATSFAALCLAAAPAARAAGLTGCSIQFGSINFGTFSSSSARPIDSSTLVSGRCSGAAVLRISLGTGRSASFDRALTAGAHRLRYNLFLDAPRAQVWGDGTRGTQAQQVRVQGRFSFPVYARIFPNQAIPAGAYSDDLVVTVDF